MTSITFLGHASFQVNTPDGQTVLIDPWFTDNPKIPAHLKDHLRADLILITHGHDDHLDRNLKDLAAQTDATIVAQAQCRFYLATQGVKKLEPMNKGGSATIKGFKITMTLAYHSAHITLPVGETGYFHEAIGYVLETPDGLRIYFAGDTALFGDMRLIGELYRPHIAVLPIGDRFTMGPREAAYALRLLGVSHVIPMHYGTFPALTGTPEMLAAETSDLTHLTIHALQPGETLDATPIVAE